MKRWITRIFATIGGVVVVAAVLSLVISAITRDRVADPTILVVDLEKPMVESVVDDPLARIMLEDHLQVREVVDAIDRAADDDRVVGLVARIGAGGQGLAAIQEVRQAVERFQASDKPAVAYAETIGEVGPGNEGYYLASAFDEIYLQQSGDIGLTGLISHTPFLAETWEKLHLEPRMDHRHEYKNALNTFTETEFTEAHEEAEQAVLDAIFDDMVEDIAADRGLDRSELRELVDEGPFLGEEAVEAGLVDRLAYRRQVHDRLEEELGVEAERMGLRAYLRAAGEPHERGTGVAVIHGTGGVARGESGFQPLTGAQSMGSDSVTRAFRDAIEDDDIEAILFRVDSPGGSYVASDAIWYEVSQAREAGKPVVVSFGNVAASGGYYVAMDADRIVSQPATVTGSIGVLGGKLLTEEFWREQFGLNWDWVQSSENAGHWTGLQDYTDHGWSRHQDWLDRVYGDFTEKAAAGRKKPVDHVHDVAKGRIWSGSQALEHDLVDSLGGYAEARAEIRELLELEEDAPLAMRPFPEPRTFLEALMAGDQQRGGVELAAIRALEAIQPAMRELERAGIISDREVLELPREPDIR